MLPVGLEVEKQGEERVFVKGTYEYHHYCQQGLNDRGWGCAYRWEMSPEKHLQASPATRLFRLHASCLWPPRYDHALTRTWAQIVPDAPVLARTPMPSSDSFHPHDPFTPADAHLGR